MVTGLELLIHQVFFPSKTEERKPGHCWKLDQNRNSSQYVQDFDRRKHRLMTVTVKPNLARPLSSMKLCKGYRYYPEFTGTVTESLSNRAKSPGDPEAVYHGSEMGIKQNKNNLVFVSNPWSSGIHAAAVPKKIAPRVWPSRLFQICKVEGQLKAGFTLEFNEDGEQGLAEAFTDSIYKSPPWSQPFVTRLSSPDIQIAQMLTQRMPSWLAMTWWFLKR